MRVSARDQRVVASPDGHQQTVADGGHAHPGVQLEVVPAAAPAVDQDDDRTRLAEAVVRQRHAVVGGHELGLVREGARYGGERHPRAVEREV